MNHMENDTFHSCYIVVCVFIVTVTNIPSQCLTSYTDGKEVCANEIVSGAIRIRFCADWFSHSEVDEGVQTQEGRRLHNPSLGK
jgi:hypothetical protein